MALDLKDRQILYFLDRNCRQSLTQLSKSVHLNRNAVEYRMKKMESDGVIRGYFTQINTPVLGFITFRIFFNISNATKEQEQSIIKFFKSEPRTIWFFRVLGRWDYDVLISAKDLFEIEEFLKQFQTRFNPFIEEKNIAIISEIYDLPKDYLIGKKRNFGKHIFKPLPKAKLSLNEAAILQIIGNNARIRLIELAKKAGLSINTAKKTLRELVSRQIIQGFRVFIDTGKTGFKYYKVHINLKQYASQDYQKIRSWLESKPEVISINHLINGDDLEVEVHLPITESLDAFVQSLRQEFSKIIKNLFVIEFTEEFVFRYMPEEIRKGLLVKIE